MTGHDSLEATAERSSWWQDRSRQLAQGQHEGPDAGVVLDLQTQSGASDTKREGLLAWKHRSECWYIFEKKWGSEHCWSSHRSVSSFATMAWYVWWNRHRRSSPAMPATAQQQMVASGTINSCSMRSPGRGAQYIAGPEHCPG